MHDGEFNLLVGESGDEDIRPPKCSADAGLSRLSTILFGVVSAECGCVCARGLEDAVENEGGERGVRAGAMKWEDGQEVERGRI